MEPIQEHVNRMQQDTFNECNKRLKEYFAYVDGIVPLNSAKGKVLSDFDLYIIQEKRTELFGEHWKYNDI